MDASHGFKRSPKVSPARREKLLGELAESGLSVVEFARRRGMRPETFYRWRCDASKDAARSVSARRERGVRALSFVEVSSDAQEGYSSRPMIVRLGRDVEVEVAAATQLDWVAQLNSKLRELQC